MFPELDDHRAIDEQLLAIFQLANGILSRCFQAALNVIDFNTVAQLVQLRHDVADLLDHQIRGKVTMDVVDRLHRIDA